MVTTIVFIGHNASELQNTEEKMLGQNITDTVQEQAKKTLKFFDGTKFSKIYTSNLAMAIETAKTITKKEPIIKEELADFNKIVFEKQPENTDKFNENIERALKTKAFFEEILRENRDQKLLIITNDNVIRYLVTTALKLKPQKAPNIFIDKLSITSLFFEGQELISIGCLNSTTHLFLNN